MKLERVFFRVLGERVLGVMLVSILVVFRGFKFLLSLIFDEVLVLYFF